MNEQLTVKNFGPITEATVDFKRVTVFIGPTGGGKSTLAKLAATFRERRLYTSGERGIKNAFTGYGIDFIKDSSEMRWQSKLISVNLSNSNWSLGYGSKIAGDVVEAARKTSDIQTRRAELDSRHISGTIDLESLNQEKVAMQSQQEDIDNFFKINAAPSHPRYIPAERILFSILDEAWPILIKDKIGFPPVLLFFAQGFLTARSVVSNLTLSIFEGAFEHFNGKDFVVLPNAGRVPLNKAASGIQSVTPMLVLLDYLSRNTEYQQSFIIEEPELNLYPTAQQGLMNWLVEKCTRGDNDLTITTHSPYILSSCNLLLEAFKVAQQRPELEDEIAAIVPKAYWLNPDEFAAYYVADGTVRPITDERTHLIGGNELDAVSGDISDSFRKLLRLQKQKPASV